MCFFTFEKLWYNSLNRLGQKGLRHFYGRLRRVRFFRKFPLWRRTIVPFSRCVQTKVAMAKNPLFRSFRGSFCAHFPAFAFAELARIFAKNSRWLLALFVPVWTAKEAKGVGQVRDDGKFFLRIHLFVRGSLDGYLHVLFLGENAKFLRRDRLLCFVLLRECLYFQNLRKKAGL